MRSQVTAFWLAMLFASHLHAEGKSIELYVVDYPPYSIVPANGPISGIDVDVARAAFAEVGINADIQTAPWKRILKNITHGRIAGTITCSKRPGRETLIEYSDKLSEVTQVAIAKQSTKLEGLSYIQDLRNFSVTAVDGWGIQKELVRENIPHRIAPDAPGALNSVIFRDIDIFYNGELPTLFLARKMGLQGKIKTKKMEDKPSTPFFLCLSKKYPGSKDLINLFNQGLKQIKRNGIYDQIYSRYL